MDSGSRNTVLGIETKIGISSKLRVRNKRERIRNEEQKFKN